MTMLRAIFAAIALWLVPATAQAEWREATSEHFVIVSGGTEEQLVRFSQRLEAVHWLMTQATGVTPTENGARVRIYLVARVSDVRQAMGNIPNNQAAGFYRAFTEGAIAVVPRDQSEFSSTILFHEYAHHFMLQYLRTAFPPWYVEGFAEVVSTASFQQSGHISYGIAAQHRAYDLELAPWVSVARMMAPRTSQDRRAGVASYGQYWLAAHYFIFAAERRGQLSAYLRALNQGQSVDQANATFTGGIDQLDVDMRRYLRRNSFTYQSAEIPASAMTVPVVRVMRPGEAAIIDDELQASRPMSAADHVPVATRVRALAVRFPDDPAVALLEARLWRFADRFADAEAAVDRALALAPDNVRALTLRGQIMLEARRASDGPMDAAFVRSARAFIVRANRLDPEDQVPLIAYYESFGIAGQAAPDAAIDGLYKATRLVPQEPGLRMTLAMELITRRNLTAARTALAPLALNPHNDEMQDYALTLIQWIDDGAVGDVPQKAAYTPDPVAG